MVGGGWEVRSHKMEVVVGGVARRLFEALWALTCNSHGQ